MCRSFLVLILLLAANPDGVLAQATNSKNQPTNNQSITNAVTVATTASTEQSGAQHSYREGIKLTEEGQLSQAVEELQQAISMDPEYAEAYAALGRAYFKLRQWQNAVDCFRHASELKTKQRASHIAVEQGASQQESKGPRNGVKPASPNLHEGMPPVKPLPSESSVSVTTPSPNNTKSKPSEKTNESVVAAKSMSPEAGPRPQTYQQADENNPATTERGRAPQQTNIDATALKPNPGTQEKPVTQQNTIPQAGTNPAAVKSLNSESPTPQPEPPADGRPPLKTNDAAAEPSEEGEGVKVTMSVTPSSTPLESKSVAPTPTRTSSEEMLLTKIYRVGPNDVLDVQIIGTESSRSTLFTVTSSGFLEHPMLPEPILVTGFTPEEISTRIEMDLSKRALLDNPNVVVGVRDYASHSILVSGLVKDSGTKFLRREAIPLYVVVADAQPLPQAARVSVLRNEMNQIFDIDLTEPAEMNFMVHPSDVITLQPNVTQFFYISGEVKFPGEKTFRRGLTLTQAIITAGGSTGKTKVAQIARDDGRGFLVETKVDLKEIQAGKTADPIVQPGDRITILR